MSATLPSRRRYLAEAEALAEKVIATLRPSCERVEVAGSIRRRAASVGDLELVCNPRYRAGLFGDGQPGESLLDIELVRLVESGKLAPGRCNGPRMKNHVLTASGILDHALRSISFSKRTSTWGLQVE